MSYGRGQHVAMVRSVSPKKGRTFSQSSPDNDHPVTQSLSLLQVNGMHQRRYRISRLLDEPNPYHTCVEKSAVLLHPAVRMFARSMFSVGIRTDSVDTTPSKAEAAAAAAAVALCNWAGSVSLETRSVAVADAVGAMVGAAVGGVVLECSPPVGITRRTIAPIAFICGADCCT